ncbi:hypothetical protein [Sellimonas intestinalis]|uniref:hypothetical protein n=1 Tax=Sellimonas intestinalis TaxID=1653434 RepID=UPI0015EC098C|nr:hypothetical protein [Sellimonas intestinalis]MBA2213681.1 hypothetical protein [Sellimonas intestinalis]
MKSKLLKTIGTALSVVLCFGMTALAAPSPSAGTVVSNTATAVNASGQAVNVTVTSEIPEEYREVVAELQSDTGFAKIAQELDLTRVLGTENSEDLMLLDVKEVQIAPEDLPATITFSVAGVSAETKGTILHYSSEKGAWEVIDTSMGAGTMSGTFTSLSPVAFVIDKTTAEGSTTSEGSAVSPKTGTRTPAAAGLAGLFAIAGLCAVRRRVL